MINSYTQRIGRLKNQLGTIDPSARIELQIDALNWEKEYVKRKLAEFRLDPTLSEREREVNVEACERLLDQIMDTLRHTNTTWSGRSRDAPIWHSVVWSCSPAVPPTRFAAARRSSTKTRSTRVCAIWNSAPSIM